MSVITKSDLDNLNTVYWEVEEKGSEWAEVAGSLSKIYYFCEARLNDQDFLEELVYSHEIQAVLVEEDTTLERG